MTILDQGNVGIGTTAPANNLHIVSSSANILRLERSTAGAASYILFENGDDNTASIGLGGDEILRFMNSGSTERMVIDSVGNVGIGTTAPAYPLDIVGATINLDNGSGSSNATLRLTGRNSGTGSTATILSNFTGGLVFNAAASQILDFKQGKIKVLVATDVAARGLHIENITHVYNFELPMDLDSYIHRVGRTARAGKEGKSISIVSEHEYALLQKIVSFYKQKITKLEKEEFPQLNIHLQKPFSHTFPRRSFQRRAFQAK